MQAEQQALVKWIQDSFKNDFQNVKVDFERLSEKIDGYVGEVNFFTVQCQTASGIPKIFNVVVKTGKRNPVYREMVNTGSLFRQEITTYEKIFPLFDKFQEERGIGFRISFPKCYATGITKQSEMIMMENLKSYNYVINDRKTPLNCENLKLILKFYAEFHAVSLAMQDQKNMDFENLVGGLRDSLRSHLHSPMLPVTKNILKNISQIFLVRNEIPLYLKVKKLFDEDKFEDVFRLFDLKLPYRIISHGDAWNNNIMYKYEDNSDTPIKVAVLDWQMVSVRNSPVYDILQLLYCSCSPEDLFKNWKNYLKVYHDFLSGFLQKLGTNPDIFPFATLLEHWKRLSLYGLIFVPMILKLMYFEIDDIGGYDETSNIEESNKHFSDSVIKDERYYERVIGLFKFYFEQTNPIV